MNIEEYTGRRVIYKYNDLVLSSYVRIPKVEIWKSTLNIAGAISYLYLGLQKREKASYKISIENAYDIVNWLNDGLHWFYDEKYEDMFYLNDENEIIFNMDYKDLHLDTYREFPTDPMMRIYPNAIRRDEFSHSEYGIILLINRTENSYPVPLIECRKLISAITNHSFQMELNLIMNAVLFNQLNQIPINSKEIVSTSPVCEQEQISFTPPKKDMGIWKKDEGRNNNNGSIWTK